MVENKVGPKGGVAIAEAIAHGCPVLEFQLSSTLNAALHLQSSFINYVINNLANEIGVEGGKAFAKAIVENKRLESLDLAGTFSF
jgi:hypothetical protein